VQYYRQGSGATDPDDYVLSNRLTEGIHAPDCGADAPGLLGAVPTGRFTPFFAAQNYRMLFVTTVLTPELFFRFAGVQNLDDGTGIAVPTVTVAANGWWDISVAGEVPYVATGNGGEFSARPKDLLVGEATFELDLSGLVPDATVILWTRASF
jgi:hypothetical protein